MIKEIKIARIPELESKGAESAIRQVAQRFFGSPLYDRHPREEGAIQVGKVRDVLVDFEGGWIIGIADLDPEWWLRVGGAETVYLDQKWLSIVIPGIKLDG